MLLECHAKLVCAAHYAETINPKGVTDTNLRSVWSTLIKLENFSDRASSASDSGGKPVIGDDGTGPRLINSSVIQGPLYLGKRL